MTLTQTNRASRALLVGLVLIAAATVTLLSARTPQAVADPISPPGNGHAGEHGRHKGRPFQSPSVPE